MRKKSGDPSKTRWIVLRVDKREEPYRHPFGINFVYETEAEARGEADRMAKQNRDEHVSFFVVSSNYEVDKPVDDGDKA